MPVTYLQPDDDSARLLAEARAKYHAVLDEVGVSVSMLMAIAPVDKEGNAKGPALKERGRACYAKIKIHNLKDRVLGKADAHIDIDGDRWPMLDRATKLAVLDHELEHLSPVFGDDEEGKPVLDDAGRPKLVIVEHDVEVGWFRAVAERHGKASIEMQQARTIFNDHGQALFPFLEERVEAEVEA